MQPCANVRRTLPCLSSHSGGQPLVTNAALAVGTGRSHDATTRRSDVRTQRVTSTESARWRAGSGGEPLIAAPLFRHVVAAGPCFHIDAAYSTRDPSHCGPRRVVVSSRRRLPRRRRRDRWLSWTVTHPAQTAQAQARQRKGELPTGGCLLVPLHPHPAAVPAEPRCCPHGPAGSWRPSGSPRSDRALRAGRSRRAALSSPRTGRP